MAHVVTLVAGLGATIVRKSVYGIMINLLQALYAAKAEESSASNELLQLIEEFTTPHVVALFGLTRPTPTSEYASLDPPNDKINIDNQEALAQLISRTLEVAAGSRGLFQHRAVYLHADHDARSTERVAFALDESSDSVRVPILIRHSNAVIYGAW